MNGLARHVCSAFPETRAIHALNPLGNHGGFSGAFLWRVETAFGPLCLKAWPWQRGADSVQIVHSLMRQARRAGLSFVPVLSAASTGATWVEAGGRCWELATWLPGGPELGVEPSPSRLRAAMIALAQIHQAWRPGQPIHAVPAALHKRIEPLGAWEQGDLPIGKPIAEPVAQVAQALAQVTRGREQLRRWITPARQAIETWLGRLFLVQPCLCDIWHAHVLFEGDRVTGIVDYGGVMSGETVACDLARLLGSTVGDDERAWQLALDAYAEVRPLSSEERELARVLDWTGVVVAAGTLLGWLCSDRLRAEHVAAAIKRLEKLVGRMEGWEHRLEPQVWPWSAICG